MLGILAQFIGDLLFFFGYVGNTNSFPEPLAAKEERKLLEEMEGGSNAARSTLIEHNLRLVAHIAKKYASPRREQDDLISIGTIGLIKAVSTFDIKKTSSLATYASRCIENEILMSLRAEKKQKGDVSLNEPIGTDGDGNEISLCDVLGSDAEQVHRDAEQMMLIDTVRKAVKAALSKRERLIVEMRYGLYSGRCMAQREVGEALGISRSYVSRIEKKALKKLYNVFDIDEL